MKQMTNAMIKRAGGIVLAGALLMVGGCGKAGESASSASETSSSADVPTITFAAGSAVKSVSSVGMVTGPDSFSQTQPNWDLGGTDLGIPIYNEATGTMYIAFGDSYSEYTQSGNPLQTT